MINKYAKSRLLGLCLVSLLLVFNLPLRGQDETAIRSIIKEGDLKKLDKADAYKVDADKLVEEANRLNMEVFTVQADPGLDKKVIGKKTAQLESQAQQKQLQASALYEKCNEIKFILYKQYLDEFWNAHAGEESNYLNAKLLEEQASDIYFQATSYRIEAKKMDEGYAKVEKLTESNNLEIQAIQKQLTALGIYHDIGESVSEKAPPVENFPITTPEQPVEDVPVTAVTEQPVEDVLDNVTLPVVTTPENAAEKTMPEQVEINPSMAATNTLQSTEKEQLAVQIPSPGLIFRIQIAASKVPLTMGQLKRIYQGNYPVEMISENGCYKYQFIGVRLYSDALQIVRSVTTPGTFIVAYENGTKINLADAVRKNKELENMVKTFGIKENIQEIEFHLQLAASKMAMPPDELKALYGGREPVTVIYEDRWYKYHLKAGNSPEMAEQFRQSGGIAKAFIVPYRRAVKITFYEAIHE
jgi:hypothetical protein